MTINLKIKPQFLLIWLFHISAIIGISLGYSDWFLPKTPLNLMIILLVMFFSFKLLHLKNLIAFLIISLFGFSAEVLGVRYSWFFGEYVYGNNLGYQFLDVPVLIGINWAILSLTAYTIISKFIKNKWIKAALASLLMLSLDFLMEFTAPRFDFWEFENNTVPFRNYASWFMFAYLFMLLCDFLKIKGNFRTSMHVFGVQLLFFIYFYVYF